jgi:hypothetical protein
MLVVILLMFILCDRLLYKLFYPVLERIRVCIIDFTTSLINKINPVVQTFLDWIKKLLGINISIPTKTPAVLELENGIKIYVPSGTQVILPETPLKNPIPNPGSIQPYGEPIWLRPSYEWFDFKTTADVEIKLKNGVKVLIPKGSKIRLPISADDKQISQTDDKGEPTGIRIHGTNVPIKPSVPEQPDAKEVPTHQELPTPGTSEIGKNLIKNVLFPPFPPLSQNPEIKNKKPGVNDDDPFDIIPILFFLGFLIVLNYDIILLVNSNIIFTLDFTVFHTSLETLKSLIYYYFFNLLLMTEFLITFFFNYINYAIQIFVIV